jgi:hypothetical protein
MMDDLYLDNYASKDVTASRELLEQLHNPMFRGQGKVRMGNELRQNAVSLSSPVLFTRHNRSEKRKAAQ